MIKSVFCKFVAILTLSLSLIGCGSDNPFVGEWRADSPHNDVSFTFTLDDDQSGRVDISDSNENIGKDLDAWDVEYENEIPKLLVLKFEDDKTAYFKVVSVSDESLLLVVMKDRTREGREGKMTFNRI